MSLFSWFTNLGHSKTAALIVFFSLFVAICIHVFVLVGKKRRQDYDDCRYLALLDDEDLTDISQLKQQYEQKAVHNQNQSS